MGLRASGVAQLRYARVRDIEAEHLLVVRDRDEQRAVGVAVADFKRMIGFDATNTALYELRRANRTEVRDGVEYVTFRMWEPVGE